jgi:peptidoglycan/xylan/chitin deacetylase (PgdA/CDA1 family)
MAARTGYSVGAKPRGTAQQEVGVTWRVLLLLVGLLPTLASAQTIAFTFDDGLDPRVQPQAAKWNEAILSALRNAKLLAMYFPCGKIVDTPEGRSLVARWSSAGHAVGNHTYSHWNLGSATVSVEAFEADVLREQAVVDALPTWRKRLRFPMLKEGDTAAKRDSMRAWMRANGYLPGSVSIDASDWYYDIRFQKLPAGDGEKAAMFKRLYLAHLWDRANYYESLAKRVLGRSPQHVLLLHTNAVNAAFLPDVIEMFRSRGWKTVDADQAFSDPLYGKLPQIVPAGESVVWALAKESGVQGLRYPGEDSVYEKAILDAAGL